MKTRTCIALSLFLLTALSAVAQTPDPFVREVVPAFGPMSGGTLVAIHGSNLSLPPNFACLLPCPTRVVFGGVEAELIAESNELLVVRAPQRKTGAVDIEILTGDGRRTTARSAYTYRSTLESGWERLLLPIYLDGRVAGANGSVWETKFWIRNNGPTAVSLAPWVCPQGQACPAVFPLTRPLQPGESLHSLPAFFRPPTANRSRVLHVTRDRAETLSTGLRIYDTSRDTLDAGAEIPVVRERDLHTTGATLHGIPVSDRFRILLRVYDMEQSEARFSVRVFEETEGLSAEPIHLFEMTATTNETGEIRSQAAYAESPALTNISARSLRVVVEPLTPGSRFWTFASVTNNDTQRVTLITP